MGELLPRWRQQDLLGAAGPGLLRGRQAQERKRRRSRRSRKGPDIKIEGQREDIKTVKCHIKKTQ